MSFLHSNVFKKVNKDTHEAMNEMSIWPHISDAYNNTGMTIWLNS